MGSRTLLKEIGDGITSGLDWSNTMGWPNGGDPLPVQAMTGHNKSHTLWDYLPYFEFTKVNWCRMTKLLSDISF